MPKINNLPNEEIFLLLKSISKNDTRPKVRLRANIVLLSLDGYKFLDIAKKLNCDKDNVRKWIHKWNEGGIKELLLWRSTDTWLNQVKRRYTIEKLVTTTPKSLSLGFTTWSLEKLSKFFKNVVNYPISSTTIWRDMKIIGLSYKKTKDSFIFKSPDYDVKRAELKFLEHYLPDGWRIIYIDEKGPVHALRYEGHSWSFDQPIRDVRQKSYGKISFLGGYDKINKYLSMIPMESNNSESFCKALDEIRFEFIQKSFNHLILVMDNATIHHSDYTKEYFKDDRQIEFFYLPTYSPELNPIEIVFKHYSDELLMNNSYSNKKEIIEETKMYSEYYSTLRKEIYA